MPDLTPSIVGSYANRTVNVVLSTGNTPPNLSGMDLTITDPVAAGDCIVVIATGGGQTGEATGPIGVSGIVDPYGNTYARLTSAASAGPSVWLARLTSPMPALTTLRLAGSSPGFAAVALVVHDLSGATVLDGTAVAAVPQSSGSLLDLDSGAVTVSQPNVLLLAAGTWATASSPDTGNTNPAALVFDFTVAGAYTDQPIQVWEQHVHYSYFTGEPETLVDFWSNSNLTLLAGSRALATAAGSYHAVLHFVSGSPTNAPARTVLLLALRGLRNRAPLAPILAATGGFDATTAIPLSFTFADPDDGDAQSAAQVVITQGATTIYDSGKQPGGSGTLTVPGGTLTNGLAYQWTVRTWDLADSAGPYAAPAGFTTAPGPSAVITSPAADGAVIPGPQLTVTWLYTTGGGGAQTAYQLRVLDAGLQRWSSGRVASAAVSAPIGTSLQNGRTVAVELTVWDGNGVASPPVLRTVVATFTPPPLPTLTATADNARGRVVLLSRTPAPTIGQSPGVSLNLQRRTQGATDWTTIAAGLPPSATFHDYGAVDEVVEEYRAVVTGQSSAQRTSAIVRATLVIEGVFIHAAKNPAGTSHHFLYDRHGRSHTRAPAVALLQYAGRDAPVAQFDARASADSVHCDLTLPWPPGAKQSPDQVALEDLAQRRDVLCYRDHRSRKFYGVLARGILFDDQLCAYEASFDLSRVSYDEGAAGLALRVPTTGDVIAGLTPTPLGADTAIVSITVTSDLANDATWLVRVGGLGFVDVELAPGQEIELPAGSPADVLVMALAGTPRVNWVATLESL